VGPARTERDVIVVKTETPEPAPEGDKARVDRRVRHEARQREAGYTRAIVRCHKDDVEKIKAYAARLLAVRRGKAAAKAADDSQH